ncbi:hypothetical protein GE09DRAFT_115404 [Coniochaeta sp. 2T2.1]|nr:hypothetical protein GE09DRAFT_115404 [Coniochaeta sp. 2T2.1]
MLGCRCERSSVIFLAWCCFSGSWTAESWNSLWFLLNGWFGLGWAGQGKGKNKNNRLQDTGRSHTAVQRHKRAGHEVRPGKKRLVRSEEGEREGDKYLTCINGHCQVSHKCT